MSALAAVTPQSDVSSPEAYAARLYERHSRAIFGICMKELRRREDADDAVQTTFVYALLSLRRGVVPQMELPWLITIARNACSTRRRSGMRRGAYESPQDLDSIQDRLATPDRSDVATSDDFRDALRAIPESQRRALLLREWKGLSYDEIGTELGLSQAATEALLFRARQNVAQRLGGKAGLRTLNGLPFFSFLRSLFQTTAAKTLAIGAGAALTIVAVPAAERQQPRALATPQIAAVHVHQGASRTPSVSTHRSAQPRNAVGPVDRASETSDVQPTARDAVQLPQTTPGPKADTPARGLPAPPSNSNTTPAAPLEKVGGLVDSTMSDVSHALDLPAVSLPAVTAPTLPVAAPPLPVQVPELPSSPLP